MLRRRPSDLEPIRAELFGVERLEQHATTLAAAQPADLRPRQGYRLLAALEENARILQSAYTALTDAVQRDETISPAAEWLIDNFHIVDEQLLKIREDLPPKFYRQLPKLTAGPLADYPRVYGLAWAFVAHTDSRFDADLLERFVRSYQRVVPLTMGELWALPITLRILLVENLRRIAERIVISRDERVEANQLADLLLAASGRTASDLLASLRPYEIEPLERAFAVELVQRLRESDPDTMPVVGWLERRLAEQQTTPEDLVRVEHASQLAAHATVANIITSMRQISAFDWATFFESVSLVEGVLRRDPAGIYPQMDFATRDTYRHAVELLSRGSTLTEQDVAQEVIARTARYQKDVLAKGLSSEDRPADIGYHLIREGRRPLERELGYRRPLSTWLPRAVHSAGGPGYLGGIALVTALLLTLLLIYADRLGAGWPALVLLAVFALVPASDLAIAVLHRDLIELLEPRRLPKLDFENGVPERCKTVVAVPTLLTSEAGVREQVERLERHYLANADGHLSFALLSDWPDALEESLPEDDRLLAAAADALAELNGRYGPQPSGEPRFLLYHRRRRWNPREGRWMGWERKRGKIHELNRLLRGATDTTYLPRADGLSNVPARVRYVITLDADTRLPPGAAHRLVGAMAHPLNQARFDPAMGRVTSGYGILQPRITPMLPALGEGSLYHRVYSGPTGIDPYASAVSDVYQDLFAEGSYVGKGIYDVDAFEAALAGRVPEDTLLSHDLFEGSFARAGLITDVELFDDFPSHYEVSARRIHRWARGDWQLLPWIVGRSPVPEGEPRPGSLPLISRWKMFDNLRRTLSPPSTFLLLLSGWALLPISPLLLTGFVIVTIAMPAMVPVISGFVPRRRGIAKRAHLKGVAYDIIEAGARIGLALVFTANRAIIMADAIVRTLVRLYVTGKHRLEWVPAALAGVGVPRDLVATYRAMWRPVAMAVVAAVFLALVRPEAALLALPILLLWVASPAFAHWLSLPLREYQLDALGPEGAHSLRLTARRTWRFFDTFVQAEDNWLPPDNFQELPEPVVARRTSPTNIGVYLLSAVAARDFGWIGTLDLVERLERTFGTLESLDRLHGHLYNWYDTATLVPLEPRYVSTIDSGNLAGHLLALAEACRSLAENPSSEAGVRAGIADAVTIARQVVASGAEGFRSKTISRHDLDDALRELAAGADGIEGLVPSAATLVDIAEVLAAEGNSAVHGELAVWARAAQATIASHLRDLREGKGLAPERDVARRLRALAVRADTMAGAMNFAFLYDRSRKLFSIGYRPGDASFDSGYYDLLASEARQTSMVAIAKGDVPLDHWFHLGRSATPVGDGAALLSWSGSMFEYLMPYLVMEVAPGTLLDRTQRRIVGRQIRYGAERGIPWGISESAYNARDLALTYQYSHFGVPGLGLTRGLSEDLVVAPYATALAAMVAPRAAVRNFERLAAAGGRGAFGFYEALDYTPARVPTDEQVAVVRAYMAHHQGMTIIALANTLLDGIMRRRFHAVPMIGANELLLQERMPRDVAVSRPRAEEVRAVRNVREITPPAIRWFTSPHHRVPRTHLLSNGRYSVMVTNAGAGYSRWRDLAVTRWREDTTRDNWGAFVFIRDAATGAVWSAGYQPTAAAPDDYAVAYSEDRAEFRRRDEAITTRMEIIVSPEDDGELRRVTIKNLGARTREIELTTYAEVVLAPPAADAAHPAFQNLFVQTEFVTAYDALLATRRPRAATDARIWVVHVVAVEGETVGALQVETDRSRFLDRGRDVRAPSCIVEGRPLSNTTGPVLDPVLSLRRAVRVRSGETARVTFSTLIAESREAALSLADKYRDPSIFEREAALAWTQAQVQLQHLGITPDEAHLFQRLGSRLLYLDPALRPASPALARNTLGQQALWPFGVSGDRPIVLVRIDEMRDRDIVRQLLRAHEYWRWKGLAVDLVVFNEHPVTYWDDLQVWIERLVRVSQASGHEVHSGHGEVHVLRADEISAEDRDLLLASARVILLSHHGSLAEQLDETIRSQGEPPPQPPAPGAGPEAPTPRPKLSFFNGLGGFAEDGREYVTILGEGQWTPAPWINVIANAGFGFQVSECGSGFTWAVNSRENRLTPWSNDPVSDPSGEALYVRDDETGAVWTPTALPIREDTPYIIRHGQGWSRFEHESHEVALTLLQFVPLEESVKISRLTIENRSLRTRRLSVTAYAEWVLGVVREQSAPHVTTELDAETGALFARNRWGQEFAGRVAFADLNGRQTAWTADRTEFIGRNGTTAYPAGVAPGAKLGRAAGGGLDPCAALRQTLSLRPGERVEVVFLLGQAENDAAARALVTRWREVDLEVALATVTAWWEDVLGALQVRTPDLSMSFMLNRWLLYQALACRVWARSAFYQSGGAYGFRDQLQDVMALVVARREIAREHLLRSAARQFVEGDVQHWWHPPSGRGARTRISDDRIWLPFAVAHFLQVTDDTGVLDESVPFLDGEALPADKSELYFEPTLADSSATLFEHCARALDISLAVGRHGLPLIGGGDWNDGMNRVGHEGAGESVWLAWFLHLTLTRFIPLAEARGEGERVARWSAWLEALAPALEEHGWDGDWYRRAFYDDGTPLGSAANAECRIDSIAQSWAVLSGAAPVERAGRAMKAVEQYLVRRGDGLVLLFTPPFDETPMDPGYIKGYLPGVRENGGQYTHAALWSVLAYAALGDGDQAAELFSILNPINHASTRAGIHRYKVEPYVAVADVYAEPPHVGRGGWTWYTGSAGWMYRAGIEWILGFRLRGTMLHLDPCIPRDWPGFEISFRYHSARYELVVENPHGVMRGVASAELDGEVVPDCGWGSADGEEPCRDPRAGARIPLADDGAEHRMRVILG